LKERSNEITMQTLNTNLEKLSPDASRDKYWLSYQFNSAPFLLYKCWLVLNFAGALIVEYETIVEGRLEDI